MGALVVTSEKHHEIMLMAVILMGMVAMVKLVMVITDDSANDSENVSFSK